MCSLYLQMLGQVPPTNPALPTEGSPAVPFKLPFPTLQHSTNTQRQF